MPSVPDLHFEAVEGLVRVLPLLVAIPRILTSREAVNTHESSPQCSLSGIPRAICPWIGPSTLTNTNRIQILANFPICLQIQIVLVKFSSVWRILQIFALKLAFLLTCFGICARWEWLLSADTNTNANTFEMDKYK